MLGEVVEDRYRVEAELGEGAMGRVYRARHVKVGREVALKVMHRAHAQVPAIVERFAREAMIAARLRHPNLVSVLDVGSMPDRSPMIVLELAPGRKLSQLIDGPLARDRVIALVRQLLRGLDHAHAAGLIHRDLKPDNILVETAADGSEIPRIVDFGIAVTRERDDSVAGRRLTEANTVIGTPFYMSPEQARGQELDQRSDLFSLGVIVYELLAGMLPFSGTSVDVALANVAKDPPPIAERAGVAVDPLLEAFARKLMARRPDARFQSAREALAVLELVDRDRLAAAKALALASTACGDVLRAEVTDAEASHAEAPHAEAPHAEVSQAGVAPTEVPPTEVPHTRGATAATRVSRTTHVWLGCSLAALAAAAAALLVASTRTPDVPAPALDAAIVEQAETSIAIAQRAARTIEASRDDQPPGANLADQRTVVTPPRAVARANIEVAPARAASVVAPVHELVSAPPAAAVAERYVAVGQALRGGPDELWQRYRRIRINEALATGDGRRSALDILDQIERALATR